MDAGKSVCVASNTSAANADAETMFEVILTAFGLSKINVIKEVRSILGLGLKEAKEFVEAVPKTVKSGVVAAEAEKIKAKLEAVGASVEVR